MKYLLLPSFGLTTILSWTSIFSDPELNINSTIILRWVEVPDLAVIEIEKEKIVGFAFDAKTGYKWNNFQAKLRLRYTNSDDFSEDEKTKYFRTKFNFKYTIKKLNLEPYIAYELYRDLDGGEFSKARWKSGLQYKINKHHRVGAYFRLNDYWHSEKESVKIIGLSYKLKL